MSVVWRRPSPLTTAGPRFARHGASVLWNYPSRPSICPWSSSVPVFVAGGVQNVMWVVQRFSVVLATWSVQFRLSLLIFSMISHTFFSALNLRPGKMFSLSSEGDTMFDFLFLWGGIHGNAMNEVEVMIDFFDFVAVSESGFVLVLSELVVHNLGLHRFMLCPTLRLAWLSSCSISWSS